MQAILGKVTAFVTRAGLRGRELLVFRHPSAGVQLPAGTLEEGEVAERGVLRELAEETGITGARLLGRLATLRYDLPGEQRAMLRSTRLRSLPLASAPPAGYVLERGCYVQAGTHAGEFVEVTYEERDLNTDPPALQFSIHGWVPQDALAVTLVRHLYHLTPQAPLPDGWDMPSDHGHIFACYWTPLVPRPRLVDPQDAWLEQVYERLVAPR